MTRTRRLSTAPLAAAVAALLVAGCGGDGDSATCVDFDEDSPPMGADLVALSAATSELPDSFESDPPVPVGLAVDSVSEVTTVDAGGVDLDVENGVSVVLVGAMSVGQTAPIYTTLVGACSESGTAGSGDSDFRSIVGFTGDRAVRFHVEDGQLTVSEYDR